MPWVPQSDGDFPTLGWHVADQMAEYLGRPDAGEDERFDPYVVTREMQEYLNELYRIDPRSGKRVVHRSVLMRPRGWGKSPFVAAIMIAEAMFEVVPDGWDADGQPVAVPWSRHRTPYVVIAAVSEEQTSYTWNPLLEMLRNGSAPDEFNCDPMDSFVALEQGSIRQITSSPKSAKGAPAIAASMDQTETWVASNHGTKFAQTLRNNATKRGGVTIETPNAYRIGEGSVAENSFEFWDGIKASRNRPRSIYFDVRPTPKVQVDDDESLIFGLRVAYGDSAKDSRGCVLHDPPCEPGWVDLERIRLDFRDTSNDPGDMMADFLNVPVPAAAVAAQVTVFGEPTVWARSVTTDVPPGVGALGLAMTADRAWISIVGASAVEVVPDNDPEGVPMDRVLVAPILRTRSLQDAIAELKRIQDETECRILLDEKGPAASLVEDLERGDVGVETVDLSTYAKASGDFYDGITATMPTILHLANAELDAQVTAAGWRWINDQRVIGRRKGDDVVETDLLEAAILAASAVESSAFAIY